VTAPGEVSGSRWQTAPAVWDSAWIPPDDQHPWDELAELRETHVRLRAASTEAADAAGRADRALEALRRQRQEALVESYRVGVEPEVTEEQRARSRELAAEAAEAHERASAVMAATIEFLDEATATIATRREAWLGDLEGIEAERQADVQAARRALAEAEAKLGTTRRLRHWVDRTGGLAAQLAGEHIAYSAIPVPAPQPNTLNALNGDRDEWVDEQMREQLVRLPANQPPDKEAMYDALLDDIERVERKEIDDGVRNA
jgi:hypothetical protein